MKLHTIIYTLCICLSFMSYPCTSSYQANNEHGVKLTVPMMPRKLKVNEEAMVQDHEKKDVAFEPFSNKLNIASPAIETNEIDAKTRKQEDMDEAKEAEYFTMDYRPRKKRPPVHNRYEPSSAASSP